MKKDNNKNNKLTDEEIDLIATRIVSKLIDITDLANWYRTSTYKVTRESFEISEEEELLSELAKCMTLMNVYTFVLCHPNVVYIIYTRSVFIWFFYIYITWSIFHISY